MFLFPSDASTEIMPRESRWEETWHASQRDPCKQRHHNRPTLTPGLEDCGYLANVYPKEHARWRCEGRLLVFCAESSGLGSFMKAFPAAVVASILTERALILECPFDHQAVGISNRIGRFFRGANSIDWSAKGLNLGDTRCYPASTRSCVANKTVPQVHVPQFKTPRYMYSRDMVQGHKVEGKIVGFHASEHTSIDKVLRGGSQAGSGAIIQGTLDNITNHFKFPSPCVSRTFFQPTDTLLGLQQRVVPAGTPYMALHVRLGDGSMANTSLAPNDNKWLWSTEARASAIRQNPGAALACFAKRSAQYGLKPLVISDTPQVEHIARKLGWLSSSAIGRAVHLGMRAGPPGYTFNDVTSDGDSSKVFLDWWLLAIAVRAMTFDASSFLFTARWRNTSGQYYVAMRNLTEIESCVTAEEVAAVVGICAELCNISQRTYSPRFRGSAFIGDCRGCT